MAQYLKNDVNYHRSRNKTSSSNMNEKSKKTVSKNAKARNDYYSAGTASNSRWGDHTSDGACGGQDSGQSKVSNDWPNLDPNENFDNASSWSQVVKNKSKKKNSFRTNSKPMSFTDASEEFPSLGISNPRNVWAERKEKFETLKSLEPQNENDEEDMIRKAMELSRLDAKQAEERQRKLAEEYKLQMLLLEMNPEHFPDFCTDEEISNVLSHSPLLESCSPNTTDPRSAQGEQEHYPKTGNIFQKKERHPKTGETIQPEEHYQKTENTIQKEMSKAKGKTKKVKQSKEKAQKSEVWEKTATTRPFSDDAFLKSTTAVDEVTGREAKRELSLPFRHEIASESSKSSKTEKRNTHSNDVVPLNSSSTNLAKGKVANGFSPTKTKEKVNKAIKLFGGWGTITENNAKHSSSTELPPEKISSSNWDSNKTSDWENTENSNWLDDEKNPSHFGSAHSLNDHECRNGVEECAEIKEEVFVDIGENFSRSFAEPTQCPSLKVDHQENLSTSDLISQESKRDPMESGNSVPSTNLETVQQDVSSDTGPFIEDTNYSLPVFKVKSSCNVDSSVNRSDSISSGANIIAPDSANSLARFPLETIPSYDNEEESVSSTKSVVDDLLEELKIKRQFPISFLNDELGTDSPSSKTSFATPLFKHNDGPKDTVSEKIHAMPTNNFTFDTDPQNDKSVAPHLFNVLEHIDSESNGDFEVLIEPPKPSQTFPEPQIPMQLNPMMVGMMNPILMVQQMLVNPFLYRQLHAMSGVMAPLPYVPNMNHLQPDFQGAPMFSEPRTPLSPETSHLVAPSYLPSVERDMYIPPPQIHAMHHSRNVAGEMRQPRSERKFQPNVCDSSGGQSSVGEVSGNANRMLGASEVRPPASQPFGQSSVGDLSSLSGNANQMRGASEVRQPASQPFGQSPVGDLSSLSGNANRMRGASEVRQPASQPLLGRPKQ